MLTVALDVECYTNYFLVMFKSIRKKNIAYFEYYDGLDLDIQGLKNMLLTHKVITFNGINYDMPMITYALAGATNKQLKTMSDDIIKNSKPQWMTYREYNLEPLNIKHTDIKEPSAGVMISLKIYGGRLHVPKLQDLPIEPDELISPMQRKELVKYCENDLDTTIQLYTTQLPQFKLRHDMGKQYHTDLSSKSDAQIAEQVFRIELQKQGVEVKLPNIEDDYQFNYNMPSWIKFKSPELNSIKNIVENTTFTLSAKMKPVLPDELNKAFTFNNKKYKFGIGGIHSQEKKQSIVTTPETMLFELDVASYYPNIILKQGLYPKHLTVNFLNIYSDIVERRILAKHSVDNVTAASLKIVCNGSYGKFGSQYSFLFSPDLMIQTTITGQLALMMLIEMVEQIEGVDVVSANTDGIVIHTLKSHYKQINDVYYKWEIDTGYDLEDTHYYALHSMNVNNYLAIKSSGGTKGKGIFASPSLMKNPNVRICYLAIEEYLTSGTPIENTICSCNDITKFIVLRTVKGGAIWRGEKLGKAVRWYYSTEGESIHYVTNGNKVATSDSAQPVMNLPDKMPEDIDYNWYITTSEKIMENLGC